MKKVGLGKTVKEKHIEDNRTLAGVIKRCASIPAEEWEARKGEVR